MSQSVYGQHVIRRTTIDPPALNHYKQLIKRPSSERPADSFDDGQTDLKMFMTVKDPTSNDLNNDSSISNDILAHSRKTTVKTNNFPHEAMLLSHG